MKKIVTILAVLCCIAFQNAHAQIYDDRGNIIWENLERMAEPDQGRIQNFADQLQRTIDDANAHRREMERIDREQAVERQRLEQEQWAQQEQIRIQQEQAERAAQRNWNVTVYGTTLWRDSEPAGLKDREEQFTVTASSAAQAETKAIQLFRSKWNALLIDSSNIWANAVIQ